MQFPKSAFCFLIAFLYFWMATTEANACSCIGPRPPCEAYGQASAVFIGVVTADSPIPLMIEGNQYQQKLITFAIETGFPGIQGAATEVITGMGGGDCGYSFKRG
jgi:hypothetical protein